MIVTVTTQQELDQALADHGDNCRATIVINSPRGAWLQLSASGSATVEAFGSATVEAFGSATVQAFGSATVRAFGSATVEASGSATVRAFGSATVRAGSYVAVHLHSAAVTLSGGVVIDVTEVASSTDPLVWADYHGAEVDDQGRILLHKAVDGDLTAGHGWTPTRYPLSETVEAPDWSDDHGCGGGLHASPHPHQALRYAPEATRMLVVAVDPGDLRPIFSTVAKAKASRVHVLREVALDGSELIEKAARAWLDGGPGAGTYASASEHYRQLARYRMGPVLAAVADDLRAAAWDEGYMATGGRGHHECEATNPYRQEARDA